jgi:hypothetical protein
MINRQKKLQVSKLSATPGIFESLELDFRDMKLLPRPNGRRIALRLTGLRWVSGLLRIRLLRIGGLLRVRLLGICLRRV